MTSSQPIISPSSNSHRSGYHALVEAFSRGYEACDRRILEFAFSTCSKTVAQILKAEGWYGPKTTIYYIEFRVRRLREKRGRPSTPIQP